MDVFTAQFDWAHDGCVDRDEATLGRLRLFVNERLVWGRAIGIDWVWRDLLLHLAENWGQLLYEGWLGQLDGRRVDLALRDFQHGLDLALRVGERDEEDALDEEARAFEWEQVHNLARYLPGLKVPDIHIWATTGGVMIETPHQQVAFPRTQVEAGLSRIGEEIAQRLVQQGFPEDAAVAAWNARHPFASDNLAASATGFSAASLAAARGSVSEFEAWGDLSGRMAGTIWLEAASVCYEFGSGALKGLFSSLGGRTPPSDRWESFSSPIQLDWAAQTAEGKAFFDQAIVTLARGLAGLSPTDPLRVLEMAYRLGIELRDADLDVPDLAAVALFGTDLAPLVAINTRCFGLDREPLRRLTFTSVVSWLADAVRDGRPAALALRADFLAQTATRRAQQLLLPVEALEEFVAADPSVGVIGRIESTFGAPPRIIANLLSQSAVRSAVSVADRNEVDRLLGNGLRTTAEERPYAKIVR